MAYKNQIFKERECTICGRLYIPKTGNCNVCTKACRMKRDCEREKIRYHTIRKFDEKHKKYIKEIGEKNRKLARKYIDAVKKESCCEECGFEDMRALVFHHRDPSKKRYNIPEMCTMRCSLKTVKAEIAKCDILCQNCHTILHYKDSKKGFYVRAE